MADTAGDAKGRLRRRGGAPAAAAKGSAKAGATRRKVRRKGGGAGASGRGGSGAAPTAEEVESGLRWAAMLLQKTYRGWFARHAFVPRAKYEKRITTKMSTPELFRAYVQFQAESDASFRKEERAATKAKYSSALKRAVMRADPSKTKKKRAGNTLAGGFGDDRDEEVIVETGQVNLSSLARLMQMQTDGTGGVFSIKGMLQQQATFTGRRKDDNLPFSDALNEGYLMVLLRDCRLLTDHTPGSRLHRMFRKYSVVLREQADRIVARRVWYQYAGGAKRVPATMVVRMLNTFGLTEDEAEAVAERLDQRYKYSAAAAEGDTTSDSAAVVSKPKTAEPGPAAPVVGRGLSLDSFMEWYDVRHAERVRTGACGDRYKGDGLPPVEEADTKWSGIRIDGFMDMLRVLAVTVNPPSETCGCANCTRNRVTGQIRWAEAGAQVTAAASAAAGSGSGGGGGDGGSGGSGAVVGGGFAAHSAFAFKRMLRERLAPTHSEVTTNGKCKVNGLLPAALCSLETRSLLLQYEKAFQDLYVYYVTEAWARPAGAGAVRVETPFETVLQDGREMEYVHFLRFATDFGIVPRLLSNNAVKDTAAEHGGFELLHLFVRSKQGNRAGPGVPHKCTYPSDVPRTTHAPRLCIGCRIPEFFLTNAEITTLREQFDVWDRDASGNLDPDELRDMLRALGKDPSAGVTAAVVNEVCQQADEDGDGNVDFDEFLKGYAKGEELAFRAEGTALSFNEFMHALPVMAMQAFSKPAHAAAFPAGATPGTMLLRFIERHMHRQYERTFERPMQRPVTPPPPPPGDEELPGIISDVEALLRRIHDKYSRFAAGDGAGLGAVVPMQSDMFALYVADSRLFRAVPRRDVEEAFARHSDPQGGAGAMTALQFCHANADLLRAGFVASQVEVGVLDAGAYTEPIDPSSPISPMGLAWRDALKRLRAMYTLYDPPGRMPGAIDVLKLPRGSPKAPKTGVSDSLVVRGGDYTAGTAGGGEDVLASYVLYGDDKVAQSSRRHGFFHLTSVRAAPDADNEEIRAAEEAARVAAKTRRRMGRARARPMDATLQLLQGGGLGGESGGGGGGTGAASGAVVAAGGDAASGDGQLGGIRPTAVLPLPPGVEDTGARRFEADDDDADDMLAAQEVKDDDDASSASGSAVSDAGSAGGRGGHNSRGASFEATAGDAVAEGAALWNSVKEKVRFGDESAVSREEAAAAMRVSSEIKKVQWSGWTGIVSNLADEASQGMGNLSGIALAAQLTTLEKARAAAREQTKAALGLTQRRGASGAGGGRRSPSPGTRAGTPSSGNAASVPSLQLQGAASGGGAGSVASGSAGAGPAAPLSARAPGGAPLPKADQPTAPLSARGAPVSRGARFAAAAGANGAAATPAGGDATATSTAAAGKTVRFGSQAGAAAATAPAARAAADAAPSAPATTKLAWAKPKPGRSKTFLVGKGPRRGAQARTEELCKKIMTFQETGFLNARQRQALFARRRAVKRKEKQAQFKELLEEGLAKQLTRDYDRALQLWAQALPLARALKDVNALIICLALLGKVAKITRRLPESVEYFEEHLKLIPRLNDPRAQANSFGNLGNIHLALGHLERAVHYHSMQAGVGQRAGDAFSEGRGVAGMGRAFSAMGLWREAVKCHKRHVRVARESGDIGEIALAHADMGLAYLQVGRVTDAHKCFNTDLAIVEGAEDEDAGAAIIAEAAGLSADAVAAAAVPVGGAPPPSSSLSSSSSSSRGAVASELVPRRPSSRAGEAASAAAADGASGRAVAEAAAKAALAAIAEESGAAAAEAEDDEAAIMRFGGSRPGRKLQRDQDARAHAWMNIAAVYTATARHAEALEAYQKGLSLTRVMGDRALQARAHAGVGVSLVRAKSFHLETCVFGLWAQARPWTVARDKAEAERVAAEERRRRRQIEERRARRRANSSRSRGFGSNRRLLATTPTSLSGTTPRSVGGGAAASPTPGSAASVGSGGSGGGRSQSRSPVARRKMTSTLEAHQAAASNAAAKGAYTIGGGDGGDGGGGGGGGGVRAASRAGGVSSRPGSSMSGSSGGTGSGADGGDAPGAAAGEAGGLGAHSGPSAVERVLSAVPDERLPDSPSLWCAPRNRVDKNSVYHAEEHHARSLEQWVRVGDAKGEGTAVGSLGEVHMIAGNLDKARVLFTRELNMAVDSQDWGNECVALWHLARACTASGQYADAHRYLASQLVIAKSMGSLSLLAQGHGLMGRLRTAVEGRVGALAAVGHHAERLRIVRDLGDDVAEREALCDLGDTYYLLGTTLASEDAGPLGGPCGDRNFLHSPRGRRSVLESVFLVWVEDEAGGGGGSSDAALPAGSAAAVGGLGSPGRPWTHRDARRAAGVIDPEVVAAIAKETSGPRPPPGLIRWPVREHRRRLRRCIVMYAQAQAIALRHRHTVTQAKAQCVLGSAHMLMGDINLSTLNWASALTLYKELDHPNAVALCHEQIGIANAALSCFSDAVRHFESQREYHGQASDTIGVGRANANLDLTFKAFYQSMRAHYSGVADAEVAAVTKAASASGVDGGTAGRDGR